MTEETSMEFEQQLAVALRTSAQRVQPPVDDLVRSGYRRGVELRRHRSRSLVAGGAGLAVAAVVVGSALALRPQSAGPTTGPGASSSSTTPAAACSSLVRTDALPQWAWAGFSNPRAGGVPYVLGDRRDMVAVLFGQPLSAPEGKDHSNKILWVSRRGQVPLEPLVVKASKVDPAWLGPPQAPVVRTIADGPGPSYLDLPSPGCWHVDLSWDNGKQHDSMDLVYVKPAG
jgi:hypothetical protein